LWPGISPVAYFCSKAIVQIPLLFFYTFVFLSLQYSLSWPNATFRDMYHVLMHVEVVCTGIGYALSSVISPKNAQIAAVISGLVGILFSGAQNPSARELGANYLGQVGHVCRHFVSR
jgi:hypothetical protein